MSQPEKHTDTCGKCRKGRMRLVRVTPGYSYYACDYCGAEQRPAKKTSPCPP